MRAIRYLALVAVLTGIAIATVNEHVERTQLGYEAATLERDVTRLKEARRAAILEREHAAAPEKLLARAREFRVATDEEVKGLVAPLPLPKPAKPGH